MVESHRNMRTVNLSEAEGNTQTNKASKLRKAEEQSEQRLTWCQQREHPTCVLPVMGLPTSRPSGPSEQSRYQKGLPKTHRARASEHCVRQAGLGA